MDGRGEASRDLHVHVGGPSFTQSALSWETILPAAAALGFALLCFAAPEVVSPPPAPIRYGRTEQAHEEEEKSEEERRQNEKEKEKEKEKGNRALF